MPTLFQQDSIIPSTLTIMFLGDSITDSGLYIAFIDAYFRQHMQEKEITLINLGVSSETASGLSEPEHPFPRPCVHHRLAAALKAGAPDWVVIGYGMNDGIYYTFSEERFAAYRQGILDAVEQIRQAGAKAVVMTPPPFDADSFKGPLQEEGSSSYSWKQPYRGYDEVLKRYAEWLMSLGDQVDGVVDIRTPLVKEIQSRRIKTPEYRSGDGIHPNHDGHWVMARTLLSRLFNISLSRTPGYVGSPEDSDFFKLVLQRDRLLHAAWKEHVGHTNPNRAAGALPLTEAISQSQVIGKRIQELVVKADAHLERSTDWKGFEQKEFYLNGREGVLVCPKKPAQGNPWVWRAEFLHAFDYADLALLEQGWHIAYYRLSNMYGCPAAVRQMHQFKQYVEQVYGLASKAALFGFSRGGMYAFHYAAEFPSDVLVLYLDAPVLNIASWPGGKGKGAVDAALWEDCLAVYGLSEEEASLAGGNWSKLIDSIADNGIPILLIVGDADTAVPFEENGAILESLYKERNGEMTVIVKKGVGHHPHSLEEPTPIVEFIQKNWHRERDHID